MPSTISAGTTAGTAIAIAGDTTGNLAFQTNGTTTAMTINTSQNVQLNAAAGKILNSSGNPILQQTGSVLQVVSTTKTDTFTMTGQTQTAITGLTATITPTSATSKILIMVTIGGYAQGTGQGRFILTRAGSTISGAIGDASGTAPRTSDSFTISGPSSGAPQITGGITYLDSPATTSSTTYGVTVSSNDSGQLIYINRSVADTDSAAFQRNISTITVMEIAA